jgi:hypothetical protein
VRCTPKGLSTILNQINSFYKNVQFEDPHRLPIFSLRNYKKKQEASEDKATAKRNVELPMFSIGKNLKMEDLIAS